MLRLFSLWIFISILAVAGPNFGAGYIFNVIVILSSVIMLLLFAKPNFGLGVGLFISVLCISMLTQINSAENILSFRDYSRFLVLLPLLVVSFLKSYELEASALISPFLYSYLALVLFDFIFLYLLGGNILGNNLYVYFTLPGMGDYIEYYWRHIGIMGNPNYSGGLYSLIILFSLNLLLHKPSSMVKVLTFLLFSISLLLLIETYSRTAIVSVLVAIAITIGAKNKRKALAITAFLGIVSLLLFADWVSFMVARFASFSSFIERIEIWMGLSKNLDWLTLIFGSTADLRITDNDYIFFLLRFGSVCTLFYFLYFLGAAFKLKNNFYATYYKSSLVFSFTSGVAGGVFSSPSLSYLLIVILLMAFCVTPPTEEQLINKK
ncbi:hypothetical protein [Pseudoalteromonas xiamenensis]